MKNIDSPGTRRTPLNALAPLMAMTALAAALILPDPAEAQMRGEIGIAVGERPELVEIEDLEGNPFSLKDLVGEKPLLIEFYARWCENCEALMPQMAAVHKRFQDRIEFLAISVAVAQSPRSVKRALADHPVEWTTVWDEGGRAVRAFLAPATSYIVVLDQEGVVTYTGIGPEQDIEAAVMTALGGSD